MIPSAGCVFTNGKVILAGYQKKKGKSIITGLGGKSKENEEVKETAWRETLEELFDWREVPKEILNKYTNEIPEKTIQTNGYVQYIYSFDVLQDLLRECTMQDMTSPLYDAFPFTITELLLRRRETGEAEISQLAILPMDGQTIAKHFIRDIRCIRNEEVESSGSQSDDV
jgi:hypothetical protein